MLGALGDVLYEVVDGTLDVAAEGLAGFLGACCQACSDAQAGHLHAPCSSKLGQPTDASSTGMLDPTPYASAVPGLVKYYSIPEGEAGTATTIGWMCKLARDAQQDPEFVQFARALVRDLDSKDYEGEAQRIFEYVKRNVRYILDPIDLEWVSTPSHTLLVAGQEDCDGLSTLLVALFMALGHGGSFVTWKADKRRPDEWSHVAAELSWIKGGKVYKAVADVTQRESFLGWEPDSSRVFARQEWIVAEPS